MALAQQRRERHEHVGHAVADVPVVPARRLAGVGGQGPARVGDELARAPAGHTTGRAGAHARRARPPSPRRGRGTPRARTTPSPPGALPRLLQVVRDRGGAHRLDVPELDGLVREQADRPVVVALRRVRAREGDDPRLDVPVDLEVSR